MYENYQIRLGTKNSDESPPLYYTYINKYLVVVCSIFQMLDFYQYQDITL